MNPSSNVSTSGIVSPPLSIYAQVLGSDFHQLAPVLLRLHGNGERDLQGMLKVRVGSHPIVRFLMWLARMPKANEAGATCEVMITADTKGERWQRQIGEQPMVSRQRVSGQNLIVERVGALAITLKTKAVKGNVWQRSCAAAWFGLPLPAILGLQSVACERAIDKNTFYCDVRLRSPLLGCLLHYSGRLQFNE